MATKELVHVPRKRIEDVRLVIWRASKIQDEVYVWPDIKYFVDQDSALNRAKLELSVGKAVEIDGVTYGPEVPGTLDPRLD